MRARRRMGWAGTPPTPIKHPTGQEKTMTQSTHDRAAELHNLAAHAHAAAAVAHGKGDHLTAHELTKQAHEHSMNVHKLAEELGTKAASSSKTKVGMPEPRADLNPPH